MFKTVVRSFDFFDEEKPLKWSIFFFIGPLFLLLSLFLISQDFSSHYESWIVIFFGLFFLVRFIKYGIWLSLSLLFFASSVKHLFLSHHYWQLGLEITIALGFFITYACFSRFGLYYQGLEKKCTENEKNFLLLKTEKDAKEETILKEKEELIQLLDFSKKQALEKEEKCSSLLDFTQTLRLTIEKYTLQNEELLQKTFSLQKQIRTLMVDNNILLEEKEALKDQEILKKDQEKLLQQLNSIRVEKYQTQLINETLARLLSKETLKLKESAESIAKLSDEKRTCENSVLPLQREIAEKSTTLQELQMKYEEQNQNLAQLQQNMQKNEAEIELLTEEKNAGRTQLLMEINAAKKELQHTLQKLEEKNSLMKVYEKQFLQNRNAESSYVELRKQFEEKCKVLHETRLQLFQMETNFLTLQKDLENESLLESEECKGMIHFIHQLIEENTFMQEEHQQLIELVAASDHLSKSKSSKKKSSPSQGQLPL